MGVIIQEVLQVEYCRGLAIQGDTPEGGIHQYDPGQGASGRKKIDTGTDSERRT